MLSGSVEAVEPSLQEREAPFERVAENAPGLALNAQESAAAPTALIDVQLSSAIFLTLPALYFSHRVVDVHWVDRADPSP